MKKLKEKIENLSPEEVQKELLKLSIDRNKKLSSISFAINFIGWTVLIAIIFSILKALS